MQHLGTAKPLPFASHINPHMETQDRDHQQVQFGAPCCSRLHVLDGERPRAIFWRMRKILAAAAILFLTWQAVGTTAEAPLCLPYEPEAVVVMGVVQRALAYGPPGFGETPDRDAKEIFYSLELGTPICVLGGDDADQPAEKSIRQLQIAFIKMPVDRTLPGQRVRIIGTLFTP
jgi:hypothetical protein